ncbi:Monogalactosyldiacylglycerol synthase [Thermaerobacter marianensis DSM 12885]|uniref:Monogalactosyldiacylglycerol synthase n=1 Tax=Thermaerobacter marianensis (strain ATCC 700841 / DSM 12885 / JCM 10246 / 7p75a) TaxID=644966 RepID=E6SHI9_THEM7|nr:glycosyltransferase [Thermaerobacter marianensis]ADU51784.1 Monogalactosyldiacylglycerol synthase [Thermaerobacter marianensis DSM 12885]
MLRVRDAHAPRLLILSASYGAGHDQVAHAVRDAVLRLCPAADVPVWDFFAAFVSPWLNRAVQRLYLTSIKHWPQGYGLFYRLTGDIRPDSPFQRWLNSLGADRLLGAVTRYRPDAILCTFPTPAGVLSEWKGRGRVRVPLYTVITDHTVHSQWIHPHVDVYFVSSPEVARGVSGRGVDPARVIVTGIPIRGGFREIPDPQRAREALGLDPRLPVVLVMAGAFGALGGVPQIVATLMRVPRPLQAVVVAGRDRALAARLEALVRQSPVPMRVFGYREDVPVLMGAADLLITKAGGVTTSEALAAGLPMIIYRPIPGQEEANTAYLVAHGAALRARNAEELGTAVADLLARPERRAAMARAAWALARADAAERVARVILAGLAGGTGEPSAGDRADGRGGGEARSGTGAPGPGHGSRRRPGRGGPAVGSAAREERAPAPDGPSHEGRTGVAPGSAGEQGAALAEGREWVGRPGQTVALRGDGA